MPYKNGSSDATINDRGEKEHLHGPTTIPRKIKDHKLFKKTWIHASRHIIINTDGKEETGKSQIGRGHWVTDI